MKHFLTLMAVIFLSSNAFCQEGEIAGEVIYVDMRNSTFIDWTDIKEKKFFKEYTFEVYDDDQTRRNFLRILKGKDIVFKIQSNLIQVGLEPDEVEDESFLEIGKDILGDGEPNLVVRMSAGGPGWEYSIFSIGDEFQRIDDLRSHRMESGKFVDLDGDGTLEFTTSDGGFGYWHGAPGGYQSPKIVLKYKDGKYRLALDLMKKLPPTREEKKEILQKIKRAKAYWIEHNLGSFNDNEWMPEFSVTAWGYMLDFIYEGNTEEAWMLLDETWPHDEASKKRFKGEFMEQLSGSVYWNDLKVVFDN